MKLLKLLSVLFAIAAVTGSVARADDSDAGKLLIDKTKPNPTCTELMLGHLRTGDHAFFPWSQLPEKLEGAREATLLIGVNLGQTSNLISELMARLTSTETVKIPASLISVHNGSLYAVAFGTRENLLQLHSGLPNIWNESTLSFQVLDLVLRNRMADIDPQLRAALQTERAHQLPPPGRDLVVYQASARIDPLEIGADAAARIAIADFLYYNKVTLNLSDPDGVESALHDIAALVPDKAARSDYVKTLRRIPFKSSDYQVIGKDNSNDVSSKDMSTASRRLVTGWVEFENALRASGLDFPLIRNKTLTMRHIQAVGRAINHSGNSGPAAINPS